MPVQIELPIPTLTNLVFNQAQVTFDTKCFPPLNSTTFVDSVQARSISWSNSATAVDFAIAADVLIVTQADLDSTIGSFSSPDAEVQSVVVKLQLAFDGTALAFTCTGITASSAQFQALANLVAASLGVVASLDLSAVFAGLYLPLPSEALFQFADNTLFIRFDPDSSPLVNHMVLDMNWCFFIDAVAMEQIVDNFLSINAKPEFKDNGFTPNEPRATWLVRPPGPYRPIPHVDAALTGQGDFDCGVTVHCEASFSIDFSVDLQSLEMSIHWSIGAYSDNVLSWVSDTIQERVDEIRNNFNPAKFGGTPQLDPSGNPSHTDFTVAIELPFIKIGTANLQFTSCWGFPNGMAMGGPVDTGTPTPELAFQTIKFASDFTEYLNCQGTAVVRTNVTGWSTFQNVGRICAVDIVAPDPASIDITPFLYVAPAPEATTDSLDVGITLTDVAAITVAPAGKIVARVRTTRGVRMVDFGAPPMPEYGPDGELLNGHEISTIGCSSLVVRPPHPADWKIRYGVVSKEWLINPRSNWTDSVEDVAAFESSLITVPVQDGETVIFHQPKDGGMTLVAGRDGKAVIPVVLAIRSRHESASLETMNRSPIGPVSSVSKMFYRICMLHKKGALSHRLISTKSTAQIITTFHNRTETTEVLRLGVTRVFNVVKRDGSQGAHKDDSGLLLTKRASVPDIPGCVTTHFVPGFDDTSTWIAEFDDGAYRVLARKEDGSIVVTGMVPRWPKMPLVDGDWAISKTTGDRIAVFMVVQTSPTDCKCKCGAKSHRATS
jgi:hypothetical protein